MRTATILLVALLCGCATASKGVGSGALAIETLAETIRVECGNTVPDGECLPDRLITTEQKQGLKGSLSDAIEFLKQVDEFIVAGDGVSAASRLRQAEAILEAITRWLVERGVK